MRERFIPALRFRALTRFYDPVLAFGTLTFLLAHAGNAHVEGATLRSIAR